MVGCQLQKNIQHAPCLRGSVFTCRVAMWSQTPKPHQYSPVRDLAGEQWVSRRNKVFIEYRVCPTFIHPWKRAGRNMEEKEVRHYLEHWTWHWVQQMPKDLMAHLPCPRPSDVDFCLFYDNESLWTPARRWQGKNNECSLKAQTVGRFSLRSQAISFLGPGPVNDGRDKV